MTLDTEIPEVRVIHGNGEVTEYEGRWEKRRQKSDAQRALDDIFEHARTDATNGREDLQASLDWATIAEDVPAEFRAIPQLLGRYVEWLTERARVRT